MQFPKVFLAHSSADKPFVRRLSYDLGLNGVRTWLDEAEMLPGDALVRCLELGITSADFISPILSPKSLSSRWVAREIAAGHALETKDGKIRFVPVVYRRCEIPLFLKDRIYVDCSHPARYERGLSLLLRRFVGDTLEFRYLGKGDWFPTLELQDDEWRVPTWHEVSAISHRLPLGVEATWTCSEHSQGVYVYDLKLRRAIRAGGVDLFAQLGQVLVRRNPEVVDERKLTDYHKRNAAKKGTKDG
jgi:hypothetical protein